MKRSFSCAIEEVPAKMAACGFTESKTNLPMLNEEQANNVMPHCEDVSKYEFISKIGQGTYGEVFKAKRNDEYFAVKRVITEDWRGGFPPNAIREIMILQVLKNINVINLVEVCYSKAANHFLRTFYLVFNFCEHDLFGLLSNLEVKFTLGEIKMVLKQLFNAVYFLHYGKIIHRDLKPANILMTRNGTLKLADFNLARPFKPIQEDKPNMYTNKVVTLWYRPPEILLGEKNYDSSIDLWGLGCIMAEMWTRFAIMKGHGEMQQLSRISWLCGSITSNTLPQARRLKLFSEIELPRNETRKVKELLKGYVGDRHALDLIDRFLVLDPRKRISCDAALYHNFFYADPVPCGLGEMLKQHKGSMFQYFMKLQNDRQVENPAPAQRPGATANVEQLHDIVF